MKSAGGHRRAGNRPWTLRSTSKAASRSESRSKRVGLTGILCDLGANIRAERTLACRTDDPDSALESVRSLIAVLTREARIDAARLWGLGIVLPGPFGTVEETERDPLTMPTWSRAPFRERFADSLSLPVFVGNDATAAAIGEHLNGVARELRTFFYLYVSEGIGGGLFVDGQPVMGAFGNAGEIGRMHFGLSATGEVPQRLEAIASVDALRRSRAAAGTQDAAILDHDSLFDVDDEILDHWLTRAAQCLRVAIANIENLVDPEAVVIGGQVPERHLREIVLRMQPLLPSVSQRGDRQLARILIGSAGGISAALGGATLPLFSRLTTQPRAIRAGPEGKTSRAARPMTPGETPDTQMVGEGRSYE